MNDIIKKILLVGNKFMAEIHLKQLRFTYNKSETITKKGKNRKN